MEDERNTPQDEDAEEVEAHTRRQGPSQEPGHVARDADDDDEVEAHARRESHAWGPEARRE